MKKVVKKSSTKASSQNAKLLQKEVRQIEFTMALGLGLVSVFLSVSALLTGQVFVGLAGLTMGGLAVWLAMKRQEYHVLFSGMIGMLIALMCIWSVGLSSQLIDVAGTL